MVSVKLYDVHTLSKPVRHYQQYPDPVLARRMAIHLAGVLHEPMVVEPVDGEPATAAEVAR